MNINNSNIPEKTCTKYLGVIIDKYLTWKDHIHYLNIKLSKANGILTKLRYNLPRRLMKTVYYALFKPHIDYCIAKTNLEPISISMKKAVRIITFSKFDEHAQPLFKDLNLLNIQQTIKFNLGKFMWDVKENNFPNHIINYLNINKKTKSFRTITVTNKHVPLYRTKYKSYFLSTTGVTLWRDLPCHIKETATRKLFAKLYWKFLIENVNE